MKKYIILLAMAVLFCCQPPYDPKDEIIPVDLDKISESKSIEIAIKSLSDEEKKLFGMYILRKGLGSTFGQGGILPGTSIGTAIDEQRKIVVEKAKREAEAKALADRMAKENEDKRKQMLDIVTLAIVDKQLVKANYQEFIQITVALKNNSEKDLKGIKGGIGVKNMFGDKVQDLQFSYDSEIIAGSTSQVKLSYKYNQFEDSMVALASIDINKILVDWVPIMFIFQDGSTISVE